MDLKQENVIGIVGGMGPAAGLFLFNSILQHTNASSDQEHLSIIMISYPRHIADRTAFLCGATKVNPAFNIVEIIRKMESMGATVIGIPCNTSHAPEIFDVIVELLNDVHSKVKLVNMPGETCQYIKRNHRGVKRIGIMATNGTYRSGLYERLLAVLGYEVIVPDFTFQNDIIHRMIYDPEFGIKSVPSGVSAPARILTNKALDFFKSKNTDAIILGCTDLSLLNLGDEVKGMVVVDSTAILAKALVREALSKPMCFDRGDSSSNAQQHRGMIIDHRPLP